MVRAEADIQPVHVLYVLIYYLLLGALIICQSNINYYIMQKQKLSRPVTVYYVEVVCRVGGTNIGWYITVHCVEIFCTHINSMKLNILGIWQQGIQVYYVTCVLCQTSLVFCIKLMYHQAKECFAFESCKPMAVCNYYKYVTLVMTMQNPCIAWYPHSLIPIP